MVGTAIDTLVYLTLQHMSLTGLIFANKLHLHRYNKAIMTIADCGVETVNWGPVYL